MCIGFRRGSALLSTRWVEEGAKPMSGDQNPLFQDPTLRSGNFLAANQLAVGSPPEYGVSSVAPGNTTFHTHAGGQAASYLRHLADAELTRNNNPGAPIPPFTPSPQQQQPTTPLHQAIPPQSAQFVSMCR